MSGWLKFVPCGDVASFLLFPSFFVSFMCFLSLLGFLHMLSSFSLTPLSCFPHLDRFSHTTRFLLFSDVLSDSLHSLGLLYIKLACIWVVRHRIIPPLQYKSHSVTATVLIFPSSHFSSLIVSRLVYRPFHTQKEEIPSLISFFFSIPSLVCLQTACCVCVACPVADLTKSHHCQESHTPLTCRSRASRNHSGESPSTSTDRRHLARRKHTQSLGARSRCRTVL